MRLRRRHSPEPPPTRPFPSYLDTAEQTIAKLEQWQAAYVARHREDAWN